MILPNKWNLKRSVTIAEETELEEYYLYTQWELVNVGYDIQVYEQFPKEMTIERERTTFFT